MVVFAVLAAVSVASTPDPTLCKGLEVELFTCPIRNKVASVCGLPNGSSVYRFGRLGHVELEARGLHRADTGYSGGGEDQINLQVRDYTYIIYAKTVRTGFGPDGHNDPQFTSGVVVQKDGGLISSLRCGGTGDQTIDPLSTRFMPAGKFIEH